MCIAMDPGWMPDMMTVVLCFWEQGDAEQEGLSA
jgi:hypothetical protein